MVRDHLDLNYQPQRGQLFDAFRDAGPTGTTNQTPDRFPEPVSALVSTEYIINSTSDVLPKKPQKIKKKSLLKRIINRVMPKAFHKRQLRKRLASQSNDSTTTSIHSSNPPSSIYQGISEIDRPILINQDISEIDYLRTTELRRVKEKLFGARFVPLEE
jgi:hypothetical protein